MGTLTASAIATEFQLAEPASLNSIAIIASMILMATCFVVRLSMLEMLARGL